MSIVGAVPPHFRGLGGSLGPIPSRKPPLGPECLLLSPGILCHPSTGMEEKSSTLGAPLLPAQV